MSLSFATNGSRNLRGGHVAMSDHILGRVFLCGPITGTSPDERQEWRRTAIPFFSPHTLVYDPTRWVNDLTDYSTLTPERSAEQQFARREHARFVPGRCLFNIERCDVVLANLRFSKRVLIGSVFEIAWAYLLRKTLLS